LADDSASRFRQVGLKSGQSVVEIGCGPRGFLDVRADAAGPADSVISVERSEDAVARAQRLICRSRFGECRYALREAATRGLARCAFDP